VVGAPCRSEPHDVLRAEEPLEERPLQERTEARLAQFFEEREEPLDVAFPGVGPLMDEFRQVRLAHGPELEQTLAHEVEPLPCAGHGGQLLRTLPRQVAHRAMHGKARVQRLVPAAGRDDLHAIRIEPERGGEPAGLGRHRVADPEIGDHRRRAHRDREAEPVRPGRHREGLHARLLGGEPHGGDLLRGAPCSLRSPARL
jgi:hypothetical protein